MSQEDVEPLNGRMPALCFEWRLFIPSRAVMGCSWALRRSQRLQFDINIFLRQGSTLTPTLLNAFLCLAGLRPAWAIWGTSWHDLGSCWGTSGTTLGPSSQGLQKAAQRRPIAAHRLSKGCPETVQDALEPPRGSPKGRSHMFWSLENRQVL